MYNESIKAENKIITAEDLTQIFQMMGETLQKYKRIFYQEEMQNKMLDYNYQNYTFKDNGSKMKVDVDFYDNTSVTFDNYDNFMSIFYSRIHDIKSMNVYLFLYYDVVVPLPNRSRNYYSQHIHMYITENKIDISLELSSEDDKLGELYNFIKNKILNAPIKYDDVIRKKSRITNTVTFGMGLIPGMVLITLLLFVSQINVIFLKGYITYPIFVLFISYIIGSMLSSSKLDKYYRSIVPGKKYDRYDSRYGSIYKDDINSFVNSSEILIGRKVNNLENRRSIQNVYKKYKSLLGKEFILLGIISLVIIIVGLFV